MVSSDSLTRYPVAALLTCTGAVLVAASIVGSTLSSVGVVLGVGSSSSVASVSSPTVSSVLLAWLFNWIPDVRS